MADEAKSGGGNDVAKHALTTEAAKKGAFVRRPTKFHARVNKDGSSEFPAENGRYHLIVSDACPWAHRCAIVRKLKGLEDVIGITYASWHYVHVSEDTSGYRGWALHEPDPFFGVETLGEFYEKACPGYYDSYLPNRVPLSTPVLFDTKTRTIVNNESSEIIRMFNTEFNEWAKQPDLDLEPADLKSAMTEVDDFIYPGINDGVYRNGFARTQEAYDAAATKLWDALDKCEVILGERRYIAGSRFTLSDVRLFVTLARFDPVYVTHFKCNRNRLKEMPNLWNYVKEIYQLPGIAASFKWDMIRKHYFECHRSVNPHGIVPIGFKCDYMTKHDRDEKFSDAVAATSVVYHPPTAASAE